MAKMGDLIGGWRLECGGIHNLLTIEAGSHESTDCPLHAAAPRLRAQLEKFAAFAFSEVEAKDGYRAALTAFCALKRETRALLHDVEQP